jgi:predicted nucleotidyltransferase
MSARQPFIAEKREEIAELCWKHHVKRLAIFGSAVRDDFDPSRSDVDVVIDFYEITPEFYFDNKTALLTSLEQTFGRSVDLLTWKSLTNPYLRHEIESTQEPFYAA